MSDPTRTANDSGPRIGLITCVRNEARFLEAFLSYHHKLGICRAYVFLDRCTDHSERIANAFPWVQVFQVPSNVTEGMRYTSTLQKYCCEQAMEMALGEGLDWIMMLDADEFAYGDVVLPKFARTPIQKGSPAQGDLGRLCQSVAPDTEMIILRTKEVVPFSLPQPEPFWKQRFFQVDWPVARRIPDPLDTTRSKRVSWLGDTVGKSIVRVREDVRARGSHFWYIERNGQLEEPLSVREGSYYHFHLTSPEHWREKFKKLSHEPDTWPTGHPVPFTKTVWKKAAETLTPVQAREYLDQYVYLDECQLLRRACFRQVTEEYIVADILGDDLPAE